MKTTRERRPRTPRSRGIVIKVTDNEYEQIASMAADESRPTATWIYTLVRKEIARVRHNESQNRARAIRRARTTPARGR
ncbi:MAG: hypothetical protein KBD01_18290 [Acidobacteria bacterium]|nr:hypothetical protein [Acidobacteriota bacterium]